MEYVYTKTEPLRRETVYVEYEDAWLILPLREHGGKFYTELPNGDFKYSLAISGDQAK